MGYENHSRSLSSVMRDDVYPSRTEITATGLGKIPFDILAWRSGLVRGMFWYVYVYMYGNQ